MKLRTICENFEEMLWDHPLSSEAPFPIFHSFRDFMVANPDQVQINRSEPITDHEIRVGGAKTNGKHNTIIVTMPRSAINDQGYSKTSADDLWGLMTKAVETGYASPNPKGNCGSSYSIFQNIVKMTDNSVTFTMNCWMPDFTYLDQLKAAGKTKYPKQTGRTDASIY